MSTGALYNDQGGAEAAVEAGQESTPTSSGSGAAFGLFSFGSCMTELDGEVSINTLMTKDC
uniref:Uncharacterized protein n=1 Tax=Amphiprion percula TaxID=161767 RepID=A0A3P8RWI3_AMPPE